MPFSAASQTGIQLWSQLHTNSLLSRAEAVCVDTNGNAFVAGYTILNGGLDSDQFIILKYSPTGIPLWTNYLDAWQFTTNGSLALRTDPMGNVVFSGHCLGTVAAPDLCTVKYSGNGTALWTNRFSKTNNSKEVSLGMTVDAEGNVLVSGYTISTDQELLILKLSSSGMPLWTNYYRGGTDRRGRGEAVAVNSEGDVTVAGSTASISNWDLDSDLVTIKYSASGTPLWTNRYSHSPYRSAGTTVAITSGGEVVAAGFAGEAFVTIMYTSGGTPLWTNRYTAVGATYPSKVSAVVLDPLNNIVVTGDSPNSSGYADYATIKYSPSGIGWWTNRYSTPGNARDQPAALAVDLAGAVYVTGSSDSTSNRNDFVTVKYSATGKALSTNRYNGPYSIGTLNPDDAPLKPNCIALAPHGALVVTGSSALRFATVKYGYPPVIGTARTVLDQIITANLGLPQDYVYLLAATNLSSAPTWHRIATNVFDTNGFAGFTNSIDTAEPLRLFRVQTE